MLQGGNGEHTPSIPWNPSDKKKGRHVKKYDFLFHAVMPRTSATTDSWLLAVHAHPGQLPLMGVPQDVVSKASFSL